MGVTISRSSSKSPSTPRSHPLSHSRGRLSPPSAKKDEILIFGKLWNNNARAREDTSRPKHAAVAAVTSSSFQTRKTRVKPCGTPMIGARFIAKLASTRVHWETVRVRQHRNAVRSKRKGLRMQPLSRERGSLVTSRPLPMLTRKVDQRTFNFVPPFTLRCWILPCLFLRSLLSRWHVRPIMIFTHARPYCWSTAVNNSVFLARSTPNNNTHNTHTHTHTQRLASIHWSAG